MNNDLAHCDQCHKMRRDVRSCGQDANGDPDAPDLCFLCRQENLRQHHRGHPKPRTKRAPR